MKIKEESGLELRPLVFIIDDEAMVAASIADLLESVGIETKTYLRAEDFQDQADPVRPCCLILDVRMPGMSGPELQARLKAQGSTLPIIFLTGHGDIAMGIKAMKQGAADFLTKPFAEQDLIDAVHLALDRDLKLKQELLDADTLIKAWQALTKGEQEVALGVYHGLLTKQIASLLNLSEITVKIRKRKILNKFALKNSAALIRSVERLKQLKIVQD